MKRYIFNTISGFVTIYIIFVLLFFGSRAFLGAGFQAGETLEGLVISYTVWVFALLAYQDIAWNIATEAEIGTLEQLYLSPAGFAWVNLSFVITRFITNLVFVSLILVVMMLTSGYWFHLDLVSLLPLVAVTIAASYGIGFIMGGLALIFKRIQASFQILQFILVAFVAVPINLYAWVKYLPLAMGNRLLYQVMVNGARLWELSGPDLLVAAAVGLGYFFFGLAVFSRCINVARDRGLMGHY